MRETAAPETTEPPAAAAAPHHEDDEEEDLFGEAEEESKPGEGAPLKKTPPAVPNDPVVAAPAAPAILPPALPDEPKAAATTTTAPAVDPALVNLVLASAIPKKDVVSGLAPSASKPTNPPSTTTPPHMAGSIFGLSDAVKIPFSVDTKLLEGSILAQLKALPAHLANDALQEYDDALQIKGGSIRNKGAYLYGVISEYLALWLATGWLLYTADRPSSHSSFCLTPCLHACPRMTTYYCTQQNVTRLSMNGPRRAGKDRV